MANFLLLCWEFFKTGLFSIGGGLATIPFLQEMSLKYGWFSLTDLTTMVAISESTPGPMGVNMATYVGNHVYDFFGGFRVIIMTVANSSVKSKVLKLLPKLKTEETDGLCVA